MTPVPPAAFAAAMAGFAPFEAAPVLAVAVSGGADSLALALLARHWAEVESGLVVGLVVDHGLRPDSAAEAALTLRRLGEIGVVARVLTLSGLAKGPGLAARARAARYAALEAACAEAGILHLLLGHHAADQAETVEIRRRDGSGPAGLAGMSALVEHRAVRLLRPLLVIPPGRLRTTLQAAGLAWVEDPSNRNPVALRNRIRLERADPDGTGPAIAADLATAAEQASGRIAAEAGRAAWLGANAAVFPDGHALLAPGPIDPAALGDLLRVIAGRPFAPPPARLAAWCAAPRPATLGGVRLLRPGRLAVAGWLLVREAAAMAPPRPAVPGAVWDGRFRVIVAPAGLVVGALGDESADLRRLSPLPAALLRTLPALRRDGVLFAVPHVGYVGAPDATSVRIVFDPPAPAAGAGFLALPACDEFGGGDAPGHGASYVGMH